MTKPKSKYFKTSSQADAYVKRVKAAGYNVQVTWNSAKGGYNVKVYEKESNPRQVKKLLKRGIRGTIKLVNGRLIIKT